MQEFVSSPRTKGFKCSHHRRKKNSNAEFAQKVASILKEMQPMVPEETEPSIETLKKLSNETIFPPSLPSPSSTSPSSPSPSSQSPFGTPKTLAEHNNNTTLSDQSTVTSSPSTMRQSRTSVVPDAVSRTDGNAHDLTRSAEKRISDLELENKLLREQLIHAEKDASLSKQVVLPLLIRLRTQKTTIDSHSSMLRDLKSQLNVMAKTNHSLQTGLLLVQGQNLQSAPLELIKQLLVSNITSQNQFLDAYFQREQKLISHPDFTTQTTQFLKSQKSLLNFLNLHPTS